MTRGVRTRLIAFVVASAIGIVYVAGAYLGLVDKVLGRGFVAHVELPNSGGVFIGSEVTYRGVKIGKVDDMTVHEGGLRLDLALEDEAKVPENSEVFVHNLSAVGEQYLDFEPAAEEGPYLSQGDVITGDAAALPIGEDVLLEDLGSLVRSIDKDDLRVVVDELGLMFGGNAGPLRSMITDGQLLVAEARANQEQTIQLLDNAQPVLETQAANSENIRSFARDLAVLTDTLRVSDPDIRTVLEDGAPAATEVEKLVNGLQPVLPPFLANTNEVTRIIAERRHGIEQLLVTFPRLLAAGPTALMDDKVSGEKFGRVHVNFNQDPRRAPTAICRATSGARPARRRSSTTTRLNAAVARLSTCEA
ncbi:MCE family protein [Nocardioides piscis]|uniref:MCE family protein n=1 Tax=Nocardioides piscis TaxID=2714938 RepID=A0A6G7YIZ9_9ACTN|nr:MlaD family protein [Nocardioides piscis]QIK76716.1 MCE family protein [Nocardioides piscis]